MKDKGNRKEKRIYYAMVIYHLGHWVGGNKVLRGLTIARLHADDSSQL